MISTKGKKVRQGGEYEVGCWGKMQGTGWMAKEDFTERETCEHRPERIKVGSQ